MLLVRTAQRMAPMPPAHRADAIRGRRPCSRVAKPTSVRPVDYKSRGRDSTNQCHQKSGRFSGGTGGTGGTPRASGNSGVTEGVTGWYRGGAAGAGPSVRSVPPRDVSFPRSTACTACRPAKGESEQASLLQAACGGSQGTRRCRSASEAIRGAPGASRRTEGPRLRALLLSRSCLASARAVGLLPRPKRRPGMIIATRSRYSMYAPQKPRRGRAPLAGSRSRCRPWSPPQRRDGRPSS